MKQNWQNVKFGEVVQLNTERIADPQAEGIERYVGIEHIEPEELRIRAWGLVEEGTTFTNYFKPGQVLFVKRRAYQRKVAVTEFEGVCSGDIYVLEPKDDRLLPDLLPFICQTDAFFAHAVTTSAGSLSPRTNWRQLAEYEFALPPLMEQRRIADVLVATDQVRQNHVALVATVEQLLNSILDLLISGRDRENTVETAIGPLPSRWQVMPIAECSNDIFLGLTSKVDYVDTGGVPLIRAKDIASGVVSFEDVRCISVSQHEYLTRHHKVSKGDVLVSKSGNLGTCAFVNDDHVFSIYESIIAIKPNRDLILPEFLLWYLRANQTQRRMLGGRVGSTVGHINLRSFRKLLLALPNTEEQAQILSKVQTVENIRQACSQRLQESKHFLKTLLASKILGTKT